MSKFSLYTDALVGADAGLQLAGGPGSFELRGSKNWGGTGIDAAKSDHHHGPAAEDSHLKLTNSVETHSAPAKPDLPAPEAQEMVTVSTFTVTTNKDVVDKLDGLTSLREAVALANANSDASLITFDKSLAGKVVGMTDGQLVLTTDIRINGDIVTAGGAPGQDHVADITVRVGGRSSDTNRAFSVTGASTDVELNGLYLYRGVAMAGGSISATDAGTLTITDSWIANAFAKNRGGGIYARGTDVVMVNSSVSYCYGRSFGGGIWLADDATLTAVNTTLAYNHAFQYGGGISVYGDATFINSTIASNFVGNQGGGIVTGPAVQLSLINSTVSNNSAYKGGGVDVYTGSAVTLLNSVITGNKTWVTDPAKLPGLQNLVDFFELGGNSTVNANSSFIGKPIVIDSGSGNIIGGDALLGPLAFNNGSGNLSFSPLDGSPLIGAGTSVGLPLDIYDIDRDGNTSEVLPIDGTGRPRVNGSIDVGAVEQVVDEFIVSRGGMAALSGGLGNDTMTGSVGWDTMDGGAGDDILLGGRGFDTLIGGTGADRILGDLGDDTIWADQTDILIDGGNAFDTLMIKGSGPYLPGSVAADFAPTSDAQLKNIERIVLVSAGVINLAPNPPPLKGQPQTNQTENFEIIGSSGNDALRSGLGNDRLTGGLGADTLGVSLGNDTAVFVSAGDSTAAATDMVVGFQSGADKLDFTAFGFAATNVFAAAGTANGKQTTSAVDFFNVGGTDFSVVAKTVGLDSYVYVDANKNGNFDATGDLVIYVPFLPVLTAADIVV